MVYALESFCTDNHAIQWSGRPLSQPLSQRADRLARLPDIVERA